MFGVGLHAARPRATRARRSAASIARRRRRRELRGDVGVGTNEDEAAGARRRGGAPARRRRRRARTASGQRAASSSSSAAACVAAGAEPQAEEARAVAEQAHHRRAVDGDVLQRARAVGRPRRRRIGVGLRHPAGVGEAARELVRAREGDDGAAQAVLGGAARREEARRPARHAQVLDRRRVALVVVAVDQRLAGLGPAATSASFQPRLAGVLDAVVAAARAERADDVRGVADEDRAADAEGVEQVVAVLVRADPDELELDVGAELLAQARAGDLGPADRFRVGVLVHLVVEAPDGVGHQVLPDGAALVEGRVDPGPALDRERRLEADVADAPAVGVARRDAPRGRARRGSCCWRRWRRRTTRPRARSAPAGVSTSTTAPSLPCSTRTHLALPADRLGVELADPLDQEPLEVELLQVDEGRLLGEALVLQVERVDLVGAREGAADRPGDALRADPLVDAEPVEDLEALLRVADAARRRAADADGVVLVEDDDGDAAQRQVAGERQAGEAARRR